MCAVDIHVAVSEDVGHTCTSKHIAVEVSALEQHLGGTHEVGLVASTIHVLHYMSVGYSHITSTEDVCILSIACTKHASVDGTGPVLTINFTTYLGSGAGDVHIGLTIHTAILATAKHGADLSALDGDCRDISWVASQRDVFFCGCISSRSVGCTYCSFLTTSIHVAAYGEGLS